MENKKHLQKIKCSVSSCTHNCVEDCTCRLEDVEICPCIHQKKDDGNKDFETSCNSYCYCGNENIYESKMY